MEDVLHSGTRRDLFRSALAVAGATCTCLGGTRPPCCSLPDAPSGSVVINGSTVSIDLSRVPELRRTGSAMKIVDESRKLWLLVAHPEKRRYVALDQKCTHGGGPLTYVHKHRILECTCWGHSRFALDGQILRWPNSKPGRPLRVHQITQYRTSLEICVEGLS